MRHLKNVQVVVSDSILRDLKHKNAFLFHDFTYSFTLFGAICWSSPQRRPSFACVHWDWNRSTGNVRVDQT